MGKQKEKIRESTLILAQELFSNQNCPICGSYLSIDRMTKIKDSVFLEVGCLSETCFYKGDRELI